jgi:hypothetical protein
MLLRVHAAVVNFVQLPGFVEVGQRELSPFIRIFRKLNGAAVPAIGLRHGPNGLGFELVPKRDQPSLYFGVTGCKSKPAAPRRLIAESFDLGHPCTHFQRRWHCFDSRLFWSAFKLLNSAVALPKFNVVSVHHLPSAFPCNVVIIANEIDGFHEVAVTANEIGLIMRHKRRSLLRRFEFAFEPTAYF